MPLHEENTANTLDEISDDSLIRLVYISSLTLKSRFKPAIFETVEQEARQYNQQHGITGTLCYGNGHFLQCLEGKKQVLLPIVQHIFDDKRHNNVKILLIQPITSRDFDNWDMRLVFLERWLWSPKTKKQANTLSRFLPFRPHKWSNDNTEQFLSAIQKIQTPPHIRDSGITLNAMGNMIQHLVGPHQAFIIVQLILGILAVMAIALLFG